MLRRLGLVTGWALATAAVVALGWAAVSAVAGTVAEPPPLARPPAAAIAPGTQPLPPAAAPDPGGPPAAEPAVRRFDLVGGTVAVTVTETTAELVLATPRSGFAVDVRSRGPSSVEVRFASPEHETRFRYDPAGGERVEERPD